MSFTIFYIPFSLEGSIILESTIERKETELEKYTS